MNKEYLNSFESRLHDSMARYLVGKDVVDRRLPEAHDLEECWEKICTDYLPDGVREFSGYPTVSLGWMMFIGMALAKMWDEDWSVYSSVDDIYKSMLLTPRGYDCMDEHICQDILNLDPLQEKDTSDLVRETATHVYDALMHEHFEPSTPEAFNAYVRCLHQLYYFGVAVELKRLGYHMTKID